MAMDPKQNQKILTLAASSHFVLDLYQSFYIGLIPLLVSKFGLSLFQVSLLGATSIIANSLFSPAFGLLSDRYGLKKFMIGGMFVTSVFLSILGILPHYLAIILFLFIGNLGIASFHPPSAAMAGHYGGHKKTLSTSLINFGGNFGFALGSLLVILILEKIGINYTPLAMVPGLVMGVLLIRNLPKDRITLTALPRQPHTRLGAKKLFLIISLVFAVYSLYIFWISLTNYMPVYYSQAGISLIPIGIILFLFGALGGAAGFITGYLNDRFKKGHLIVQISLALSLPCLYFIFIPSISISIILLVLAGIFLIPIQPVCIRIAQHLLPKNMGLASSLILGLSSGLAGITLIPLGKLADRIGIAALIRGEMVFLILSIALLFFYPLVAKKTGAKNSK